MNRTENTKKSPGKPRRDWRERLHTVTSFADGWIDGETGEKVTEKSARIVEHVLTLLTAKESWNNTSIGIYPLLTGGIQLEWDSLGVDWSIEVDNDGNCEISAFGNGMEEDRKVSSQESPQHVAMEVVDILQHMMSEVYITEIA